MKIKISLFIVAALLCAGCGATMTVGGKVMGISGGKFIYQDGSTTTHYKADVEPVWQACEKAVTDLKGWDIQKDRKISGGSIKTIIADEKVTIRVEYIEKNLTSVAVSAGVAGNRFAAGIIHDRIAANLAPPAN
ncbi:MAG: DUF3568 family protein [Smithellaceae bacterium]